MGLFLFILSGALNITIRQLKKVHILITKFNKKSFNIVILVLFVNYLPLLSPYFHVQTSIHFSFIL